MGLLCYFKKDEKGGCTCQVEKDEDICGAELKSSKTYNLKRHLERFHKDIHKLVLEEEQAKLKLKEPASSVKEQSNITNYFSSEKINVVMTKEKFKRHLIQLVVHHGVAIRTLSSSAFVGLTGEMADKFKISLQPHSIRKMILHEASEQKNKLKEEICDKFLFLKMDACTRHRVNYFAVNAQFINSENKLVIATLAVRDTENQHSSEFIKTVVEDVLKEFEISKRQVLALVTDNASNMTLAVKKLAEDSAFDPEREDYGDSSDDETVLDDMINLAFLDYSQDTTTTMSHMRCAAHTLQLAIRDGLKTNVVAVLISKIRKVVTAARTPKIDAILKRKANKGAILDQSTRWGSTYLMIERILEIKDTLVDIAHPDVCLSEAEWKEVEDLECLLRDPFLFTKKLQTANLTPGEFYKDWKKLLFKFAQIGGILAEAMKKSMERRGKVLLSNDVLLAAVYVDPMYRVTLTIDEQERGRKAIVAIALRMKSHEERKSRAINMDDSQDLTAVESFTLSSDSDNEDFEKHLDQQAKRRKMENENMTHRLSPLEEYKLSVTSALSEMEKIDRSSKLSVMTAIPQYPLMLQKVAYTVTALPPTQVTVERLFSSLRIIRSDLRTLMKEDLLEAILFLRANDF